MDNDPQRRAAVKVNDQRPTTPDEASQKPIKGLWLPLILVPTQEKASSMKHRQVAKEGKGEGRERRFLEKQEHRFIRVKQTFLEKELSKRNVTDFGGNMKTRTSHFDHDVPPLSQNLKRFVTLTLKEDLRPWEKTTPPKEERHFRITRITKITTI